MNKIRYIFLPLLLLVFSQAWSQSYHFGVRAGLNYSKFLGPSEIDVVDQFDINSGFHFGLVGVMDFNDYVGVGAEIMYNQLGTVLNYDGPSYYRVDVGDTDLLEGNLKYSLDISNSYISVPILLYLRPIKKLEFILGGYAGFLVSPVGAGKYEFDDVFIQYPEYKYFEDNAGGIALGTTYETLNIKVPQDDGTEDITIISKVPGAYYKYTSEQKNDDTGGYFHWFDVGLTGGVQYFINKSFYAGLRVEYGFLDLTNDQLDRSFKDLDEDREFLLRDDKDTNLNFQVSVGFRF